MNTDIVIIGAGAIGLSIARKMAREGNEVVLLEKEKQYGRGVSSRSSEVIHAGLYYKTNSLKASLCTKGKELLYEHCARYKVNHKRVGKIILAIDEKEVERLEILKKQALENGVLDITELGPRDIKKLEPNMAGKRALFSPSSGIFDTHGFMDSLFKLGKDKGVMFAAASPFIGAEFREGTWKIKVGGKEPVEIKSPLVINSAGLYATEISRRVFPERATPKLYSKKGSYARYSGATAINHIVYPALIPGLIEPRVDVTPDLGGVLRFGPTVEEAKNLEDFSIAPDLLERITPVIKRRLPFLDATKIYPDCAGIRPRIFGSNDPVEDFRFEWAPVAGWLDLWGMESPGLTASLAIAEHVFEMAKERDLLCKKKVYHAEN